jgi:hypothetical protein
MALFLGILTAVASATMGTALLCGTGPEAGFDEPELTVELPALDMQEPQVETERDLGRELFAGEAVEAIQEDGSEGVQISAASETERRVPWTLLPHLELGALYDNNIYLLSENPQGDWIFTASPGITFCIGKSERPSSCMDRIYLRQGAGSGLWIDYTASLNEFDRENTQSSLDQFLNGRGLWQGEPWQIAMEVQWESKAERSADLGTRIATSGRRFRRKSASAALKAQYSLSEKTALECALSLRNEDRSEGFEISEYALEAFGRYAPTPSVSIGVGGAFGVVDIADRPEQAYRQCLVSGEYAWDEKIQFEVRGGVELRDLGNSLQQKVNPVLALQCNYRPLSETRLRGLLERRVTTSRLNAEENLRRTVLEVGVEQSVWDRWVIRASGGYGWGDYFSNVDGEIGRTERFRFAKCSLLWVMNSYTECEWGVEHRVNHSNDVSASYRDLLHFMQVRLRF